jgi:hypothetical protein
LDRYGKKRNGAALPRLSFKKVLSWADAHFQRYGCWPNTTSGAVEDTPDERWDWIDDALRVGCRGLPGGSTLLRLLASKRDLSEGTPGEPKFAEDARIKGPCRLTRVSS